MTGCAGELAGTRPAPNGTGGRCSSTAGSLLPLPIRAPAPTCRSAVLLLIPLVLDAHVGRRLGGHPDLLEAWRLPFMSVRTGVIALPVHSCHLLSLFGQREGEQGRPVRCAEHPGHEPFDPAAPSGRHGDVLPSVDAVA